MFLRIHYRNVWLQMGHVTVDDGLVCRCRQDTHRDNVDRLHMHHELFVPCDLNASSDMQLLILL